MLQNLSKVTSIACQSYGLRVMTNAGSRQTKRLRKHVNRLHQCNVFFLFQNLPRHPRDVCDGRVQRLQQAGAAPVRAVGARLQHDQPPPPRPQLLRQQPHLLRPQLKVNRKALDELVVFG